MSSEKVRVFSYSTMDDKVFSYQFSELEVQRTAEAFDTEIFFFMDDDDLHTFMDGELTEQFDNLKMDFIWFQPGVNKRHIIQCTCGNFLESGHSMDKLAKLGLKHHKRTGHTINLRGN